MREVDWHGGQAAWTHQVRKALVVNLYALVVHISLREHVHLVLLVYLLILHLDKLVLKLRNLALVILDHFLRLKVLLGCLKINWAQRHGRLVDEV